MGSAGRCAAVGGGVISWPSSIQWSFPPAAAITCASKLTGSPAPLEKIACHGRIGGGLRGHVEDPVVGSRNVDEDMSGANAVENSGCGEVSRINNGGRAANGADLIERHHRAMIVAAANSGEAAAAIQLLVPEGKFGDAVQARRRR